jgi:hypothetical protein
VHLTAKRVERSAEASGTAKAATDRSSGEAGCKTIVAQRLEPSGMRWSVAGAGANIALRCREASRQWEEIWQRLRSQTATA